MPLCYTGSKKAPLVCSSRVENKGSGGQEEVGCDSEERGRPCFVTGGYSRCDMTQRKRELVQTT